MPAPFTLFKRTLKGKPRFYVRFRDGEDRGRAISTGQTTLGAATTWAAAELRRREAAALPQAPSLGEWLAPFWTEACPYCTRRSEEGHEVGFSHKRAMRRRLERFVIGTPLASRRLDTIRRQDLLELRTRVAQAHGKEAANMAMAAIRVPLKEAVFRGIIQADPTGGIGRMRGERRAKGILSTAEIAALLQPEAWGHRHEHLAFCLAAMTGMRGGEIRAISWGQVDFEGRRIAVTRAVKAWTGAIGTPKSGKPRLAPLPAPLDTALRAELAALGRKPGADELILAGRFGGLRGQQWFGDALREACARLGIDARARHIAPHAIRASVATWLVDAGADRRKIMSALGWADQAVMDRHYVHDEALDLSGLARVLEALPPPVAPLPGA